MVRLETCNCLRGSSYYRSLDLLETAKLAFTDLYVVLVADTPDLDNLYVEPLGHIKSFGTR